MKKSIVITYIALLLSGFTAYAQTNWQLYDDFNSGQIDPNKWEIDDSSATITVENGRAKFEHQSGFANDSSYLLLIKNAKTIIGIKATVTVESCSGDVRARMASFIGKIGDDYVYTAHEIRADRDYISSSLPVLGPAPDYEYKYNYFWGYFKRPLDYTGTPFTMSMVLTKDHAEYGVEGQGELEFSFPNILSPTDDFFKGIGTRSISGNGTCTVYFDDVYILRQPPTPAGNLLLLNE
ncbi:MAG: hypothetical protein KJP23_20670 [Deltaproteobacteria bacterium]|nr:hypothetical protein [Deltaproteobacteria bacterium]